MKCKAVFHMHNFLKITNTNLIGLRLGPRGTPQTRLAKYIKLP